MDDSVSDQSDEEGLISSRACLWAVIGLNKGLDVWLVDLKLRLGDSGRDPFDEGSLGNVADD